MKVFFDSNIPMYVAGGEHPNRTPALRLLERAQAGEIEAFTSTEVLQEVLYRYTALRRRDLAFEVYDRMTEICPVILPVTLADTDHAKRLLQQIPTLGVRDAIHAAVMLQRDIETIASFDTGFDVVPGIRRLSS
ncbi:MAG: type II toxin-antitoxin system VapC family toxin [Acidobacteriota bacterium]